MKSTRLFFALLIPAVIFNSNVFAADWGRALQFDGNDDLALIPSFISAPTGNSPYTVEAWVNILQWRYYYNGLDAYNGFLISTGSESFCAGNHVCLINGNIALTHWGRDSDTGFSIELERWYHISATWDGFNESLYINGQQVWTKAFSSGLSVGGGSLTFGKHDNVSSYWVCGQMDEVRFWNYARSQQQIEDTYLSPLDPNTPGLVGYWKFDEQDGQTILDSTANHNDGVLGTTNLEQDSDPLRVCSTLPLTGDFVSSYAVDLDDLMAFVSIWLTESCLCPENCTAADLNSDGLVNLPDFAILARHWLDTFTP